MAEAPQWRWWMSNYLTPSRVDGQVARCQGRQRRPPFLSRAGSSVPSMQTTTSRRYLRYNAVGTSSSQSLPVQAASYNILGWRQSLVVSTADDDVLTCLHQKRELSSILDFVVVSTHGFSSREGLYKNESEINLKTRFLDIGFLVVLLIAGQVRNAPICTVVPVHSRQSLQQVFEQKEDFKTPPRSSRKRISCKTPPRSSRKGS